MDRIDLFQLLHVQEISSYVDISAYLARLPEAPLSHRHQVESINLERYKQWPFLHSAQPNAKKNKEMKDPN